ncbi:class I SAM-dependent methyltransferase [Brevibacterium atlanticum]|uniref:class I SAM-dependent methyltransferase n=1 Tax=Brevibacterium atlanticum TaxID=2697563 RepID=UPI001423E1A2|nr:methyltransferase type 11 [Brevibacterium atlanticum]
MPEYADSSRTRDETPHERYERWTWIHETATMTGWDFSALAGRLVADDPPWDFDEICLEAMAESTTCLDMGTGGGERLIELIDRLDEARPPGESTPTISATEGWEPNVPLATSALEDYGATVTRYDSDHHPEMPFGDGEFDLVMNRHESYDIAEVARVLAPGGLFLTQQVDGTEAQEFRDCFGGGLGNLSQQLEPCLDDLERHGLAIEAARKWQGTMSFTDVEAVIEYLAYIPWDVPGFTVMPNLGVLGRLAESRDPIEVTQKRFLIVARKP